MEKLKKVRLFFLLDIRSKLIFLEAFFYLGWARLQINRSFSQLSNSLGEKMQETTEIEKLEQISTLKKIHQAINIMSKHTFWESKCLVRAIAGMKMLERRKIDTTLYLGTARDGENGSLIAHAWLRSGPFFITGREGMERFTTVAYFAKRVSHEKRGNKE